MSNSIWSLKGLFASPRYEIGDIYLTTRIGNPNTLLGYGTWELIPGKTLVCVDTSDTDFNTVKKTGGEKKHTLIVSEMPNHTHEVKSGDGSNAEFMGYAPETNTIGGADHYYIKYDGVTSAPERFITNSSTGGGQSHNNLQPYFTCYIWIRTA